MKRLRKPERCRSNDKRLFIIEQKLALALNMLDKLENTNLKN